MDFDEFNFDGILGEFLNESSPGDPPEEPDSAPQNELEEYMESFEEEFEENDSYEESEEEQPEEPQRRSATTDQRLPRREVSGRNPSARRMPERDSDDREPRRSRPRQERRNEETTSSKSAGRQTRREPGTSERQTDREAKAAERQAEREAKEAERQAERRRKILEKKADQRRIEEQRLAAERERADAREYMEQERAEKRKRDVDGRRKSKIGSVVFLIIMALLIAGVVFAAGAVESSSKTMPNLFVGNIPVGNMTRDDVARQLGNNGWMTRTATPLTVSTYGGIQFTVDPVQAGAVITMDDAVNSACAYGRGGNKFSMLFNYVQCLLKPLDLNDAGTSIKEDYIRQKMDEGQQLLSELVGTEPYTVDLDKGELRAVKGAGNLELEPVGLYEDIVSALKNGSTDISYTVISREPVMPDFAAIHSDIYAEVVDAKYSDDGKYNVFDETVGCDFDVSEAVNIWTSTETAGTAVVPLSVTRPSVTGDELRGRLYNDLLGTMTTYYTLSSDDRINNVNLAASKVNGTILYPGDLFSYNGTVGQRTEEAGFRYAAAYSDGEVVEELGGGACQVSSTLYCATLYARLETVERTCHQFEVAYMDQLGLDATVSWPDPDFKFRNDKTYPIKLVAYCDNDARSITFEIWGTAEDDYTVELKTDKYQYTNEDGGWVGWRTVTYRVLYDSDGNVVQVPDPYGNMIGYEYTYTNEEGKPLMDTYLFH
ncbi:MAG: VanW family protein [Eubacteriales bacterium]|nr:VanW family protein [Eubacteriales bacterium]